MSSFFHSKVCNKCFTVLDILRNFNYAILIYSSYLHVSIGYNTFFSRNAIETPGYAPYAVDPVAPVAPSPEVDGPELKNLVIIPRSQWCKIPPKWKDPLTTPVSYVYSTFTRKSHCFSHDQCFAELQYLHYRSTKYGDKPDIVYK